jgi:hypothetical protein
MKRILQLTGFLMLALGVLAEESPTKFKIGVEAGLGYNSNPYSLRNPVGDMMARIAPKFSLATQGRKLTLAVGGDANMASMFGLNGQPGFLVLTGGAGGSSTYNSKGVVSFFTQGGVNASRNLTELFVGNLTSLSGTAALGSTIRPKLGKLSLTVQGEYTVQGFSGLTYQNENSVPRQLNNQAYYLSGRFSWLFLPKTALYAESRYGFYENVDANNNALTINPLWVGGGLTGQITNRLAGGLSAHFSKIFIKGGEQTLASTSIPFGARLSLDWALANHSSIGMSVNREISPAPIFLDQASTSLNLKYNQTLWEKVVLTLSLQAGLLEYGKPYSNRVQEGFYNRQDVFGGAQLGLAYHMNTWLAFGISGEGFWRWTNTNPDVILERRSWVAAGDGSDYQLLFSRYMGNAFVRLTY